MRKYTEKDIPGWSDFVEKCKKRVDDDNKEFDIKSKYVPHAIICPKPDYCLVAMEPINPPTEWEKQKGYKAFGNWHVNYCAYNYLCKGEFKYHVTDFGKGAMSKEYADKNRDERYENWIDLLKEELKLLGNPKTIIAISGAVHKAIKYNFENVLSVWHWAYILRKSKEIINNFPKCDDCIPTEEKWKKFIKSLMEHCGWEPELIETRNLKISKPVFTYYKSKFEEIKEKLKKQ